MVLFQLARSLCLCRLLLSLCLGRLRLSLSFRRSPVRLCVRAAASSSTFLVGGSTPPPRCGFIRGSLTTLVAAESAAHARPTELRARRIRSRWLHLVRQSNAHFVK